MQHKIASRTDFLVHFGLKMTVYLFTPPPPNVNKNRAVIITFDKKKPGFATREKWDILRADAFFRIVTPIYPLPIRLNRNKSN